MRRGRNRVEQKIDHSKASTYIMFCRNTAGEILPPMVVYKAKFLYDGWVSGGPTCVIYNSADSGWFDGRTFKRWFKELFVPNFNGDGPFAVIGNSLGSHFTEEFIGLCSKKTHMFYNTGTKFNSYLPILSPVFL